MAVNPNSDKAVVILNGGDIAFGFPHIYSAVAFVERQVSLVDDITKRFAMITAAINEDEGLVTPDYTLKIVDVETYLDAYATEIEEEDELPVAE